MSNSSIHASERTARGHQHQIVCIVDGEVAERGQVARELIAQGHSVRHAAALSDVQLNVTRANATVVILVDGGRSDAFSAASLREFRSKDAASFVLLVTQPRARSLHELAAFARAGLDGAHIIHSPSGFADVCRDVSQRLASVLPWSVVHAVVPQTASDSVGILALCVRLGDRARTVNAIARWLQWDRRTINRKISEQRFRPIHDLINLGRLLHAATLLDRTMAPISVVARRLTFDSVSTLRRLCKRETGYSPTELRSRGAIRCTVAALRIRRN